MQWVQIANIFKAGSFPLSGLQVPSTLKHLWYVTESMTFEKVWKIALGPQPQNDMAVRNRKYITGEFPWIFS